MSQELIPLDDFQKGLAEFKNIEATCEYAAKLPAYKKYQAWGIAQIFARAKALKLDPFQALNSGFYIIGDKIGMSTELMAALVRRAGHSITKDPASNESCVILHGKRADTGDTWTSKFSMEDAVRANLASSQVWKKYPETMLYNRAMSTLFRQLFPDLSLNAGYTLNELEEIEDSKRKAPPELILAEAEDIEEPLPEVEKISPEKVEEFKKLLDKLPEKSREGFQAYLKANNFKTLEDIDVNFAVRLKLKFDKTFEFLKQQETKQEQPQDEGLPY